ncbi:hypothetical protein ACNJFJ_21290, partial [Mycobacterium tuberculosis]
MNLVASNMGVAPKQKGAFAGLPVQQAGDTPIIRQYMRIANRWRWVILGIVAASLVAGLVITLL